MQSYKEVTDFLFEQFPMFQKYGKTAFKPGLENIKALCTILDNPQDKIQTIHIGGTNGKGSCSHLLSAILQANDYKVGLYTSPHLVDFRERIKINGSEISEAEVVEFVNNHKNKFEQIRPSFFEWSLGLAFHYFEEKKVDIAIIEVGMGGRLDSSNIISPILSIITNIGFDHTQYLGNTLELIATEKAGIIKPNTPVIIGEYLSETRPVFERIAQEKQTNIDFAQDSISCTLIRQSITQISLNTNTLGLNYFECDLSGDYQINNIKTVLCVLYQLSPNFKLKTEKVKEGFKFAKSIAGFKGRWDVLQKKPLIICDTGHNIEGLQFNIAQIRKQEYRQLHVVIGFVSDKDIEQIVSILPAEGLYYLCQAKIKRAMDVEQLGAYFRKNSLKSSSYTDVHEAFGAAKKAASKNDLIFVGGSTFVVGDFLMKY